MDDSIFLDVSLIFSDRITREMTLSGKFLSQFVVLGFKHNFEIIKPKSATENFLK